MYSATLASPAPNLKRQAIALLSAARACLGSWCPLIDGNQLSAIPLTLVFQLPAKLKPTGISDGTRELSVFDHIRDLQGLHADGAILSDKRCSELVAPVLTLLSDLRVNARNLQALLVPVARSLLLARKLLLLSYQLLKRSSQVFRIIVLRTVARNDGMGQAHIQTYSLGSRTVGLGFKLDLEDDVIPTGSIFGDRDAGNLAEQLTAPANRKGLRLLRQVYAWLAYIAAQTKPGLGELGTLFGMPVLKLWVLASLLEEIAVSRLKMAKALLKRNAGNLIEPSVLFSLFPTGQKRGALAVAESFPGFLVMGRPSLKSLVVDNPATPKRSGEIFFLLCVGVKAIFKASHDHMLHIYSQACGS